MCGAGHICICSHMTSICNNMVFVVFGINSMSKARSNCTRHIRVQFTAFYDIQLPSKTALRSHVLLPSFCDKFMEQNYEDCAKKSIRH